MTALSPAGDPRTSALAVTEGVVEAAFLIANAMAPSPAMTWGREEWVEAVRLREPAEVGITRPLEAARAVLALLAKRAPQPGPGAEPVAWKYDITGRASVVSLMRIASYDWIETPLYAAAPAAPPHDEPAIRAEERELVHIATNNGLWRPLGRGYTRSVAEAGVWSREDGERLIRGLGPEKAARLISADIRSAAAPVPVSNGGEWGEGDPRAPWDRINKATEKPTLAPSSPAKAPDANGLGELSAKATSGEWRPFSGEYLELNRNHENCANNRAFAAALVNAYRASFCSASLMGREHDEPRGAWTSSRVWESETAPVVSKYPDAPTSLLIEIDEFLRATGMAESTLGKRAVNDGKFVSRLRDGKRCWPDTARRVRAFMAALRATGREPEVRA